MTKKTETPETTETDFSHLNRLDVTRDRTAELTMYEIEGEPTLVLAPATEGNKPYFNALLKRSGKNVRRAARGTLNAGMISDNRDEDRVLFPLHVVKDWCGVRDVSGVVIPFSKADCARWLKALPDWLFDQVRDFAGRHSNFVDDEVESGDTAKN